MGVNGGIYFQRCGVGGGRGGEAPTRWIVDGVVGERGVLKGDVSRSMAVAVEGGDGGGGGSYRDFMGSTICPTSEIVCLPYVCPY